MYVRSEGSVLVWDSNNHLKEIQRFKERKGSENVLVRKYNIIKNKLKRTIIIIVIR